MKGTRHHRIRRSPGRNAGWHLGARRRGTARAWQPGEPLPATGLQVAGLRFYSPELGRWISRDPVGELGGANLLRFTDGSPVQRVDALGLDVWIVKLKGSTFGHVYVVGDNGDGTYWASDLMPVSESLIGRLNCPANISFRPHWMGFDPRQLDTDKYEIIRHVVTTNPIDQEVRNEAREASEREDQGRYDLIGRNCRT